jgi:hypothetical protein
LIRTERIWALEKLANSLFAARPSETSLLEGGQMRKKRVPFSMVVAYLSGLAFLAATAYAPQGTKPAGKSSR